MISHAQPTNCIAFKEWAVICAALGAGRQSLILRKGGIHEGRAGFRVEHSEFWLFPTNFHQSLDDLSPDLADLWHAVSQFPITTGRIAFQHYVMVEEVVEIHDEALLPRLSGLHGWSDRIVHERFHYKHDGLYALLVRVYQLLAAIELAESPHFAGCRSWVDLPEPLSTRDLQPVLTNAAHEQQIQLIRNALV